jgi:hypothetical protein
VVLAHLDPSLVPVEDCRCEHQETAHRPSPNVVMDKNREVPCSPGLVPRD